MKKETKVYIRISILFIIILGFCYSYYRVNLGVPREYSIQKLNQKEIVKLEDLEIRANGITKSECINESDPNEPIYSYIVNLTIKNISTKNKDIKSFYRNSFLINENDFITLNVPQEAINPVAEVYTMLKSQEEININLTFNTSENSKNDIFEYYIPKELYINEIKSDLQNLKFHEKYIELNMKK